MGLGHPKQAEGILRKDLGTERVRRYVTGMHGSSGDSSVS